MKIRAPGANRQKKNYPDQTTLDLKELERQDPKLFDVWRTLIAFVAVEGQDSGPRWHRIPRRTVMQPLAAASVEEPAPSRGNGQSNDDSLPDGETPLSLVVFAANGVENEKVGGRGFPNSWCKLAICLLKVATSSL